MKGSRLFAAALAGAAATTVLLGAPSGGGASSGAPAARPLRAQLLAHVNPGGGYSGDVAALRDYAYLSSWGGRGCESLGVRVYDVRDPRAPKRVATFGDAGSDSRVAGSWTEKTIVRHVTTSSFTGDLAVTSFQACRNGGFQGFGVYDVTSPAAPRLLALVRLEPRGSHEIWLASARGRAWVYTAIPNSELLSSPDYDPKTGSATVPGEPDFRIYDVSDPARPTRVGGWGAWRSLGVRPRSGRGAFAANFVHSVITNARATRAFLSYWDLGTVILDIADPAHPRYLGRTPAVDAEGDAHSSWLAKGGTVLLETHENAVGRPFLFDIRNPRRPALLSRFGPVTAGSSGFSTGVHDPKVIGNRAYFSWYHRGVLVADISKPRRPRRIATFVPAKTADADGALCQSPCTMTWGVFPTARYVLASDMVSGLWVFRLR